MASRKLSDEHPKKKFEVPSSAHADCQWWIKHINTPDKILIPELTLTPQGERCEKDFQEMGYPSSGVFRHESVNGCSSLCVNRGNHFQPRLAIQSCSGFSTAAPDPQGASSSQQVVWDFSCRSSSMGSSDLEKRLEATGSGGSFSNSQFESV
ncbi:unnamed protein product, partial [Iphiclides podalirius]